MFKGKYKHMIDQVHPNDELLCDVLRSAHSGGKKKNIKATYFRKLAASIIAICICMSLTIPVLAARLEPVYQLMYTFSPSIAQFFMPVQKSDEDNGIKMEVASAYIHDNTAEIYITMQDLTGDRIDGTTDLYDSYSINRPFDSSASCQRVSYDEKTKTATFLISITEWGNQKITGDKITFSVKEFLSHKNNYRDVKVPLELSLVTAAKETQNVYTLGGGGQDYEKYKDEGEATVLMPSQAMAEFPVDGIDLTAIGYIDDMLHIQIAVPDRLKNDNHGSFYLKNIIGNIIDYNYNIYFTNQYKQLEDRIDYCEYVFDIPQDELENYSLYGNFVTSGMRTEGNWRVTFPLEKAK